MLGTELFHLYINEIIDPQIKCVADDTTVFASDIDSNNVHATVNRELLGIDNWLKTNDVIMTLQNISNTN